jgi:hypothetical protein
MPNGLKLVSGDGAGGLHQVMPLFEAGASPAP